ncbi:MAG: hypothetical protein JO332_06550 [Planctomycetaceae bacterium]|nr:hypothetical protein [Planctomycetaceae bacterium]
MTGVIVAAVYLASGLLSAQNPPTNLQTEQATNPTTVDDNRPDFRAQNNISQGADRFQIQVSTNSSFSTITHWNSPDPTAGGTAFPGGTNNLANGAVCPEIPYGEGAADLLTIPLLDWNTTYFWRTRFRRRNSGNPWSTFNTTVPPAQFTMAAPTRAISQQSNNGSSSGFSWRFIGVPIAIGTTVPATELLAEVPLLYRLDEPSRSWIQMTSSDVLEGGRGYIGWCDATAILTLSQGKVMAGVPPVKSGSVTTTPSYLYTNLFPYTTNGVQTGQEITDNVPADTYAGNVLFANPFYAPISWRSSTQPPNGQFGHIARLNISFSLFKWNGSQYLTYNSQSDTGSAGDRIEPFQAVGVWVLGPSYEFWIDTPAPMSGGPQDVSFAPAPPPVSDADHWKLLLEARSGSAIDTENAFGIDPQADDEWDVRDSEEPGAGSPTWVLVSMDHSGWSKNGRKYTHDFRKTRSKAGDEIVWTFTVDGNTNLPATLTWPNLSSIPAADWKLTLEDPATSTVLDLSTASSYDTQPVTGPKTMTLRATRLTDAPVSGGSSSSSGGSCGLLGPEGLFLAGWILARRRAKMRRA